MNALESMNLARRNGVSPSALHVLLAVLSNPPMKASEAAGVCGISPAAVTGLADVLEHLGFIERLQSKQDRRTRMLQPTKTSFQLFAPIVPELEEVAS